MQNCKYDIFQHLNAFQFTQTHPIMAGIFGFKFNQLSSEILDFWLKTCLNNLNLLDQSRSKTGQEFPEYEINRNDQPIFSLILKLNNAYNAFSAEHILPELHRSWIDMKNYPFIAMRSKN